MSVRRQAGLPILILVMLALAAIACAAPGAATDPTPTLFILPTADTGAVDTGAVDAGAGDTGATDGSFPEATEEAALPYFDPCTLITQAEATAALGAEAQPETFGLAAAFGGCRYDNADYSQSVEVTLLAGEDARALISLAAVLSPMSGTPDVAAQGMDFINRMESMSLADILNEMRTNPTWQGEDEPASQPVSGLGEAAYWRWYPDQNKAELEMVQGSNYLLVTMTGKPETEARPILEGLIQTALARIPTTPFSTLNVPTATEEAPTQQP